VRYTLPAAPRRWQAKCQWARPPVPIALFSLDNH